MRVHSRLAATAAGLLLVGGVVATAIPAAATTSSRLVSPAAAQPIAGTGTATPHSVHVSSIKAGGQTPANPASSVILGRDGKPAGSTLPAVAPAATRPAPVAQPIQPGSPNSGTAASTSTLALATAPSTVQSSAIHSAVVRPSITPAAVSIADPFPGVNEAGSNGTSPTPYPTAAANATQTAETVNLRLQVFNKTTGATVCGESLATLLGAVTTLSEPRIQYDNANHRFSIVINSVPSASSDIPVAYLATSQTDDACGAWWIYSIVMSGNLYPAGALLNYPYLGQDSTSILSSTNNFTFGGSYIGSAAFAMPKAIAYTGAGFSFNTFSVAFSTAPVTVAGIPTFATTTTYWLAAVPGSGYDLYSMPTSPAGAISLLAQISAPFNPPQNRVQQPGTNQTLDPLDGRIPAAGVQDGNLLWFTHGIDDQGLPTILYGAVNVTNGRTSTALAFHSTGSFDFNSSIGVSDAGNNTNHIWVNWAYTAPNAGVPVSDTVVGVAPGQGIPNEVGNDLTLVRGSSTAAISTFGAYSSVEIDPVGTSTCAAGMTALSVQEFFSANGQWATELARTTFC
jgi:hypothetical protein